MFREFVLQGRAPQIVLAVSKKAMPNYKSIADLKGKKIGVTAPGSSTSIMASFVLAKAGLSAKDVAFIGVGAGAGAIAALQSGQIDAIANLDPVMTKLERTGEIRIVSDTRTLADTRSVFGGDMPAGCLYASQSFITKNPNTTQALTNAMVRALKWLQTATGTRTDQHGAGRLSARRPRAVSGRVAAREGSDVARRPDARRRSRDVAEDVAGVRPDSAGQADRPVEDVDQRLRQEGANVATAAKRGVNADAMAMTNRSSKRAER